MKYYLKIKDNARIINVGDFFVGADGINHTYTEVVEAGPSALLAMGVHQLDELSIDFEVVYNPLNTTLRQLEELKAIKMVNNFNFRGDYYSATVRDLATVNILLSVANMNQSGNVTDVGNLMWFNPNVPFLWHTANGDVRNMDIPTFKDFAKSIAEYVMTCNICATILKHKILNGEDVKIKSQEHWPDTTQRSITESYEFFASKLVDAKYGDGSEVDEAYQSQLDLLAGIIG